MAKSLTQLITEFNYPVLNAEEVYAIQRDKVPWEGLIGEIIRRKCLKSFPAYLQASNPGYKMTAYHYSLAANLQKNFEKGPNKDMPYGLILLSASPQTGKSLTVTESFQSWLLIKNPRARVVTLGYAADFATRFGRRNLEKFSEFAPKLTHNKVKLHDNVQRVDDWETMILDPSSNKWVSGNGGMSTTGIGGAVTGKTANLMLIDDPIKNMEDATSATKVETNIEYYQSTIETRLLGNPGSLCIVMCTRWVTNDLIGWLRKHRKAYIVGDYNYAAIATDKNYVSDPLCREPGEGICPEMGKDGKWGEIIRESYTASQGGHVFNALFQGEPSDESGNLFKDENWGEYEVEKLDLSQVDRLALSIDATFKDMSTSDFVAMELWAINKGNVYLRYVVRKRMDLPDTLDKILEVCRKFPEIDMLYIEDKANGPGIISVLKKWRRKLGIDESDFPSVYPINPEGGKYSRAQTASAWQREGKCYIPCERDAHLLSTEDDFEWDEKDISFTNRFKQELGTFPYGAHDDLVDSFSQLVIKAMPLLLGEQMPEKKVQRFTRYSEWWPEMWQDYNSLTSREDKDRFIRTHGAPKEWRTT